MRAPPPGYTQVINVVGLWSRHETDKAGYSLYNGVKNERNHVFSRNVQLGT